MGAQLGPREPGLFDIPRPELLREVSGIKPEADGRHVLLKEAGFRSVQRLALADVAGGVAVALWPAELKPQAQYLYSLGRAGALVEAARRDGWTVRPSPHVAFFSSPAGQRLYLGREIDLDGYVRLWEGGGTDRIGAYTPADVRLSLWPWLKEQGYATGSDDAVLEDFLRILGRRKAHLRPGLHLGRRWAGDEVSRISQRDLATSVRQAVNRVLQSAGEPPLLAG